MLIRQTNLSIFSILLQKNLTNNKFFVGNYFFLTNNFSIFTNLLFINNNKTISILSNNLSLVIKKNKFFFLKTKNKFRNLIIFNKYLLKYKLKFSNFFKINLFRQLKQTFKLSKLKSFIFLPYFLHFCRNIFKKNWMFLTGGPVSPFSWELFSNKKLIKKNLNLIFYRNNLYFNKINKKKKSTIFKNNFFFKKILLNNFFYLKKKKNIYSSLLFLTKNKTTKDVKTHSNWFFIKPYYFLNINESFKLSQFYPNYLLINFYKNYFKNFSRIKKFKFKFRVKAKLRPKYDILFKKNFFLSNRLFIYSNNSYFRSTMPFLSKPFFFFFKNLVNNNVTIKKTLLKKKIYKFNSLWKFSRFSKFLRKNKIMLNIIFSQQLKFKKKIKSKFLNFFRLVRKLKKINIFLNVKNFFHNKFFLKLNCFKKYAIFFKTSSVLFNYFAPFSLINFTSDLQNKSKFKNKKLIFSTLNRNFSLKYFNKKLYRTSLIKNKLYFTTKEKNFFLLNRYSFILINNVFNINNFKNKYFYNIKKLLYSFSYKNEIQKYILKKYTKYSFINNYLSGNYPLLKTSTENLLNPFFIKNSNATFFDSFFKRNNEAFFILNKKLLFSNKWTYFNEQLSYIKNYIRDDFNFNIKRIRFKPGYMNLWRESRKILQNSLSLNFTYQYKLTKYLSKYNKFIKFKTFLILEMSLLNILTRARFFLDETFCSLFLKNNLIFVNGHSCNNPNFQLFIGDFIQLIINIKYYILFKWFFNLSLKKKIRLKNIIRKKLTTTIDLEEKKRNNNLPKWILFNKNIINDVPKYIEVDYFTLSALILYEPFLWTDINPYNIIDYKFGVINLYNWKYIT